MASSSTGSESFAVVGGEGFLGHAIVVALGAKYPGSSVRSLDLEQRHYPSKGQWEFHACDLTSLDSLGAALRGVSTVFHTASPWVGAGKALCEKVNVQGTENILQACKDAGVKKLVYTSSASVVYSGGDLINVDERCTPPPKHPDPYNSSKAQADALVLEANGKDGLLTCCIRPAGIFGPGDRQNIPGWINAYKAGKHKIQMGPNDNFWDWTYVDNVVHAHLLAGAKLERSVPFTVFEERITPTQGSLQRRHLPTSRSVGLPGESDSSSNSDGSASRQVQGRSSSDSRDPPLPAVRNRMDQFFELQFVPDEQKESATVPVAGEAFYITNGEMVPFWSWGRRIWYEYAGHSARMTTLPLDVGLLYATVENAVCWLTGRQTSIPKNRVTFSGVKRYYNIEKARRVLGYEPVVGLDEGLKIAIKWYKENEASIEANTPKAKA